MATEDRPAAPTVPKIVADFEFEGREWLVVFWPDGPTDEAFRCYLSDLPWHWQQGEYEDVRS